MLSSHLALESAVALSKILTLTTASAGVGEPKGDCPIGQSPRGKRPDTAPSVADSRTSS